MRARRGADRHPDLDFAAPGGRGGARRCQRRACFAARLCEHSLSAPSPQSSTSPSKPITPGASPHNFAGVPGVPVSQSLRQVSTRQILVLEFFFGCKVSAAVGLGLLAARTWRGRPSGLSSDDLRAAFHADPHPATSSSLGRRAAGHRPSSIWAWSAAWAGCATAPLDLLVAAASGSTTPSPTPFMRSAGRRPKVDDRLPHRGRAAGREYLGRPLKGIEGGVARARSGRREQVQHRGPAGFFILVGKAPMTIEGIGKQLDRARCAGETAPYVLALIQKRYSPQRLGNDLLRGLQQLGRAGYDLPLPLARGVGRSAPLVD